MELRVLGPVEVESSGAVKPVASAKQRIILAVLAANHDRLVGADELVDALWGDAPPSTATTTLRSYVSRIRKLFGVELVSQQGNYGFGGELDLDCRRFEELLLSEPGESSHRTAERLQKALDLWRGAVFGDIGDRTALADEARRLQSRRRDAETELAVALYDAGRMREAAARAEATLQEDPYREALWSVLVRSLGSEGRQADALRTFQRAAATLAEVGLEPGADLRDAETDVIAGNLPTAEAVPAAHTRRAISRVGRPVPPVVELIGREADRSAVLDSLAENVITSLVGPGGVGKTALAYSAASDHARSTDTELVSVELAAISHGSAVDDAIVTACGIVGEGRTGAEMLALLAPRRMLLVLDNCEHVVDDVASAVLNLLAPESPLRVLCTSRERLGVPNEAVIRLDPLSSETVDGRRSPAVDLLQLRMQALGLPQPAGAEQDEAAELIVSRLDGLPLAIEMAAATASIEGVIALAAQIDDRVGELASSYRSADPRHRTLDAAISWSVDLLDQPEVDLFADLTSFACRFTADDVEVRFGSQAKRALSKLVERSLLTVDTTLSPTRYRLLETIKTHAYGRLTESERSDLAEQHARWCLGELRTASDELETAREPEAHHRFGMLFDDARQAHRWARANEPRTAGELTLAMNSWARQRMLHEPTQWAEELAEAPGIDEATRAVCLAVQAHTCADRGRLDESVSLNRRALELTDDGRARAIAYEGLGDVALYRGELENVPAFAESWVAADHAGGDRTRVLAAVAIALTHHYGGRSALARAALEDVLDRQPTAPGLLGWVFYGRGEIDFDNDETTRTDHMREAIRLADSVDERFLSGVARVSIASLLAEQNDSRGATDAFLDVVDFWLSIGDSTHLLTTLRNLACALPRVDSRSGPVRTRAAIAATELIGTVTDPSRRPSYGAEAERLDATWHRLELRLGSDFSSALERGRSRSVESAALVAVEFLSEVRDREQESVPG